MTRHGRVLVDPPFLAKERVAVADFSTGHFFQYALAEIARRGQHLLPDLSSVKEIVKVWLELCKKVRAGIG